MFIRYVLDNFKTADEAIDYIQKYVAINVDSKLHEMHYQCHFLLGDENKTYVVEFINNRLVAIEHNISTNFYISGVTFNEDGRVYTPANVEFGHYASENGITPHGSGLERYNLIVDNYEGIETKGDMASLMDDLTYTNAYKVETFPQWYTEFVGERGLTVDSSALDYETPDASGLSVMDVARKQYQERTRTQGSTWQSTHSSIYDLEKKKLYLTVQEDGEEFEFDIDRYASSESLIEETERAQTAEQELLETIDEEVETRQRKDQEITNNLVSESSRAKAAEQALSRDIAEEESRAQTEEQKLSEDIEDEITRAQNTEEALADDIREESSRAKGVENTLTTGLSAEVSRATQAEQQLENSKVNKETGKSLMSSEEHSKLAGISNEANKVVVLASTQNGYIVIDGNETKVYDDIEIRELIAAKETGWVVDIKSDIVGTEDSSGNFTNVTAIGSLNLSLIKVGDNVYVKDNSTPDYWVSDKTGNGTIESPFVFKLNVLDTKIDLSNYYTKPEILALLNEKADVSELEALKDRITTAEQNITNQAEELAEEQERAENAESALDENKQDKIGLSIVDGQLCITYTEEDE